MGWPLFDQKGDDEVTIKGLLLQYDWEIAEISDSPTPIADDLMTQIRTDLDNFIASGTKTHLIKTGSQSSVNVTDMTEYRTWSDWGPNALCNDDTCSKTSEMVCVLDRWPTTQIPCAEPNSVPKLTETCTSDKCGKYSS